MATIPTTGTNKLAERIIADAETDANGARAQAEEDIRSIREENDRAVQARLAELEAKRNAAVKSALDGYRTRAALDGRKSALGKKRRVIEAAFSQAYEALLALGGEPRASILENMLRAEAEGGETVVPAKADRKAIEAILPRMSGSGLKLADRDAGIDGGFLLVGEGYEKDCSFRSLLNEARQNEETCVAKMLFD